MPTDKPLRPDLLGSDVHTTTLWILVAALFAGWVLAHFLSRRLLKSRPLELAGFVVRTGLGTAALWALWQAVARHLVLETTWSLVVSGLIGAFAIEVIVGLYQWEKRIVKPATGRWLLGLRLLLTGCVLVILVQPVFARTETRRVDRNVIVLVDDSASMQIADKDMPVVEKLALAEFEGISVLKDRPALPRLFTEAKLMAAEFEGMVEKFKLADDATRDEVKEFITGSTAETDKLEQRGNAWSEAAGQAMDENRKEQKVLPEDMKRLRNELRKRFLQDFRESMKDFRNGLAGVDARKVRAGARDAARPMATATRPTAPPAPSGRCPSWWSPQASAPRPRPSRA